MTTDKEGAGRRAPMGVILLLATAILAAGPGSLAGAEAGATLRWKFKAGEVLHYSMDQTTVSTGPGPQGRPIKETIGLVMDMTWTVASVDASGVASMAQKIDRVRTSASSPFGKFSFDSREAGDASSVAGPLFKMLVGAEFTSRLDPRGGLSDIKVSEKVLAILRGDDEPAGAQGQFSEAGLKNLLAQMVFPLPESAVEVGGTWERTMAIPSGPDGQTRRVDQTFTDKGPVAATGSLEAVEFSTRFEVPKADPNVPVTFKKEVAAGRFEFDVAAGRIARSSVTEDVEVAYSLQGKEVTQKVETTRTITLGASQAP